MLFNSFSFLFFLPLVFILYWFLVPNQRQWRNFFLLSASYAFYGWWDWRFLFLIFISSLTDYLVGYYIYHKSNNKSKRLLLAISIIVNIGILGFFKYYDFFVQSFADLLQSFGMHPSFTLLNVVLPVGIIEIKWRLPII